MSSRDFAAPEIQLLIRVTELTLADGGPEPALREVLEEIARITELPTALLTSHAPGQDELRIRAAVGAGAERTSLPFHGSLSGEAIRTGAPVVSHDLRGHPAAGTDLLVDLGLQTVVVVPLSIEDRSFGTLILGRPGRGAPKAVHVRLAQGVARILASKLDRVEARRELQEQKTRALALARALARAEAELEAFNYALSHDLRAPLRTMQGFAHALIQDHGASLSPQALDYMNRIVASGERAEELIVDLLEYSRLSFAAIELQSVELEMVVQEVLEQLAADIQAAGATIQVDRTLPVVFGHYTLLSQAVANLVSNAIKFCPEGCAPQVVIGARATDESVGLEVRDNGIGIAPDKLDRIFRVFERLTDVGTRRGTGIGLAIVRRVMERLEGRAGVESTPGEGSTFWLELPRHRTG